MKYQIKIIDEYQEHYTKESDPLDKWDAGELEQIHDIQGFIVLPENRWGAVEVNFKPEYNKNYYLLYVLYSTGNTFGREDGRIEYVGLYTTSEIAKENSKRIYNNPKENKVKLLNNEGKEYEHYCGAWTGYFEYLESVQVETVRKLTK